jgi:hypothetical protein
LKFPHRNSKNPWKSRCNRVQTATESIAVSRTPWLLSRLGVIQNEAASMAQDGPGPWKISPTEQKESFFSRQRFFPLLVFFLFKQKTLLRIKFQILL